MNPASPAPGVGASLADWLDWQLASHRQEIQLGLSRVTAVADTLALRQAPPLTLTIGGTNGKGAATRLAADLLQRMGHRVGRFSSPHLHQYRERIEVQGQPVDDALIVQAFAAIDAARGTTPLTYFEFGTLAALWCFRACRCDIQVLEVGLGGRLDAVNLMDADAALVTSIGTDHQDWLGQGRAAVGREKAGIFRAGRPAVCADPQPPPGFVADCEAGGTRLLCLSRDFSVAAAEDDHWRLTLPDGTSQRLPSPPGLPGAHQWTNAAGVVVMLGALGLQPSGEQLAEALRGWSLPGRAERIGAYWLDVAHNVEAAAALAAIVSAQPQPVHLILGMLADKPCEAVMATLAPCVTEIWLVDTPPPRGLPAASLYQRLVDRVPLARVAPRLESALAEARIGAGTVLVCGSFSVVAAARTQLLQGSVHG